MSNAASELAEARAAHRGFRWDDACAGFLAATALEELTVEDLEMLAECAQLSGRHEAAAAALDRAFALRVAAGQMDAASMDAFWLWNAYLLDGEMARANGWLARLREVAGGYGTEPAWLLVATAYGCFATGRYDDARALLAPARAQGRERADADLDAFATMLTGRAWLNAGATHEGLERLDEAMLRVTAGETSPRTTASLFCASIANAELEAHDLARGQEWERALEAWMSTLPAPTLSGPFLANCQVYRAVLQRRRGEWSAARHELVTAVDELTGGHGARLAGHACYELGETLRLLGEYADAEFAYRRASSLGATVQPGLGLMRLAQGDVKAAAAGVRRALSETERPQDRCGLLPAHITIMLAAGEPAEAVAAVDEMGLYAHAFGTTLVRVEHLRAMGEVALADGRASSALAPLRRAAEGWRELAAPYETAVTSVLLATAYRAVGDEEGAQFELEAATATFAQLGAAPDLARARALLAGSTARSAHGLTRREAQVLQLVAEGITNHMIATELLLSERTVQRHVSNIFVKLGVSSRTQAATFALEHDLVRRSHG
ncbi:response regulator transcription factor [Agromyces neolithicus]|uniref:response regulator transcription factor n=1 Tax=Agromyces neolithicus TaxID=269420 RepID=UPI0031D8B1D2